MAGLYYRLYSNIIVSIAAASMEVVSHESNFALETPSVDITENTYL